MPTSLGMMELEEAAKKAAGNWQRFDSFVWFRAIDLDEPSDWAVLYTHHRDSGLIDQSNASVIEEALQPFTEGDDPDVVMESHSHWAVGHIDGFSLRVFKDGQITEAFRCYHDLEARMDDYALLDEEDYSRREYEATLENIADAAWRLKRSFELPEGWEAQVFDWFWQHNQHAVENRDDQGGYPEEAELEAAFEALGFERIE
jgi:hypothetical protein